jgi:dihydroflavonol-4-reductase
MVQEGRVDPMKALVTGSNGFIGSHLVEFLLEKGYEVSCFVRPTSNLRWVKDLPVRFIYGDLNSRESVAGAVKGQQYVFHLAGVIKARSWDSYYRTNVIGTRIIAETCAGETRSLRRLVYVSSIAAAGPSAKGRPRDENDRCSPSNQYGESKLMGEEAVTGLGDRVPFVIIRPPNVLGPRQEELSSIIGIMKARFKPLLGNGDKQLSICFISDLVRAIESAARSERAIGETYFITDGKLYSYEDLSEAIARALHVENFLVPIPYILLLAIGSVSGFLMRLQGKGSFFNAGIVRHLRNSYLTYDSSKSERDLGFKAGVDLEGGMRSTVEWYMRNNAHAKKKK